MLYKDDILNEESVFESEPDAQAHEADQQFGGDARGRLALQMLKQVHHSLTHAIQLLEDGDTIQASRRMVDMLIMKKDLDKTLEQKTGSRVVEGVFDGVGMVDGEGSRYVVPENYASKSRLVEGDILKLIIKPDGSHVYKQIAPIERQRLVGILGSDPDTNSMIVIVGADMYKVLAASVSYFKGIPGDEAVILVPGSGKSAWAAIERIQGK